MAVFDLSNVRRRTRLGIIADVSTLFSSVRKAKLVMLGRGNGSTLDYLPGEAFLWSFANGWTATTVCVPTSIIATPEGYGRQSLQFTEWRDTGHSLLTSRNYGVMGEEWVGFVDTQQLIDTVRKLLATVPA